MGQCDAGPVGSPQTVLTRLYSAQDGSGEPPRGARVVAYASPQEATDAYRQMVNAAVDCATREATTNRLTSPAVDTQTVDHDPAAISAQPVRVHYSTLSGRNDNPDETLRGTWVDTLVLQAGNRVMYLTMEVDGQDYNCGANPSDVIGACDLPTNVQKYLELLDQ